VRGRDPEAMEGYEHLTEPAADRGERIGQGKLSFTVGGLNRIA